MFSMHMTQLKEPRRISKKEKPLKFSEQMNNTISTPTHSSGSHQTMKSKETVDPDAYEDINYSNRYTVDRDSKPLNDLNEESKIGPEQRIFQQSDEECPQSSQKKMKHDRSRLSTIKFSPEEDFADDDYSNYEGDLSIDFEAIELVNKLEREEGKRKEEFPESARSLEAVNNF